ncbi:MAG: RNA methyltransferase [Bacteroidota bacterium]|nr:RNA methyltransferase [Bacteroidota bacterium]
MKNVIHIDSLELAELRPYRTMRRAVEHVKQGIFVAESETVVKKLLTTNLAIVSILITQNRFDEIRHLIDERGKKDFNIYLGEKELLEQIVGFDLHQGIMAVAKIPEPLLIEDAVKQSSQPYLFVALDGLTNADNLGVIVRNCVAFGVNALIVGETSSSPYLRRAIRQSMGTVFDLPIVHTKNLRETLILLEGKFNTRCLAADAHANDISIQDADLKKNICIVLGSEGSGIREPVLEVCSEKITIPISDKIDSLNVASASAVFLWEVSRKNPLRSRRGRV